MHALEQDAPGVFAKVRETVFRAWQVPPIVPDLVPRWMLHTGVASLHEIEPLYICSGASDAEEKFDFLLQNFGTLPFFVSMIRVMMQVKMMLNY